MPQFHYTALDTNNVFSKGLVSASSQQRALADLTKKGLLVVNIRKEKELRRSLIQFNRISKIDKIFFTRHIHTLLESGIGLDQAVKITAEQTTNPLFRELLNAMYRHVESGQPLHAYLEKHPKHFSQFYVNLIKVGERSGKLTDVLEHLLEQQERDYDLMTKVRGAMTYPTVLVIAAICIVIFMITFVVPKITSILAEYSVTLPLSTRILIGISDFMTHYGLIVLPVLLFGGGFGLRAILKTPNGKRSWDRLKLSIPIIKNIVKELNLARMSRAMTSLLKSGVSMDRAFEMAGNVSNNMLYRESISKSIPIIQRGVALTEVLKGFPDLYPPLTVRMVEVGERSGRLDHMFGKLAHFYEKSVTNTLGNLSTIIEPFLLLFIGLLVGFIGIAILTPVWKFAQTV